MSTTVLEALLNAQCNLQSLSPACAHPIHKVVYRIGMEQLKNGIAALKNGKSPSDIIQEDMLSDVDVGKPAEN